MTREEELIRIAKKLDKMVSRNNTEGALDLLNELKSFNMTLKLLQETRIGMSVNGIRKHCTDDEVVSLAKILIKDWKRLLDAARTQSTERPNEMKNGVDSNKSTGSPVRSPSEKDTRKESSDYKPVSLKVTSSDHVKKDRKDSDSKVPKRPSVDAKKERKDLSDSKPKPAKRQSLDSSDSKQKPPKRPNLDGKKDRKDSTDSKPSHSVKRHSTDSKSDRRDSMDSKTGSSPSAKKFSSEMKESHGSKSSHPGPLQRKSSTDSIERRGKPEMPKIPTTPTSPMSPSFSTAAVPLSPYLATGETIRDKCIEMLAAALRTDDNFKEFGTNCDSMAAEIEDHIYKEMGATDMKYKNRVRSRISNLKDPKNPGLRRNVLAGGIELRRFAIMSAEEMASDELKQLRNNLTKEAIREHQLSKTSGTISDLFQCGKCGKKNCTYNQMQTRSADEPMTTFVLCNECGNRWKFC
ncbi:transcription elongation factor A protein 3 isoform X8 [Coregonus clupeaformis]|uniref:transcription elongation factor A protein 3 isoform X8 n=1 Tax=Coregonus clupeaformis TaxID=59861 RepID=UPI001BE11B7A|nr:transcription elongation factor A protein 3 isoform X8 [Coregonus clupeaformis]